MPGSNPQTGDVYYYPYIWKRQFGAESDKDRPCCVALRLNSGSFRNSNTFLFAISQSGVPEGGYGIELPKEIVLTLDRLDAMEPTYLVTSEYNSDLADQPSFDDCEYLGTIPVEFLKSQVLPEVINHIRNGSGEVSRTG